MIDFGIALVMFMQEKAKLLEEYNINPEVYFNNKDMYDILRWNKEDVEHVWWKLKKNIAEKRAYGLGGDVCPFCIYYKLHSNLICVNCSYGKRHGICENDNSNMELIKKYIQAKGITFGKIFSNCWYISKIEEIETKLRAEAEQNNNQFYQRVLVQFMQLKVNRLESKFNLVPERFFSKKDKDDILSWPDEDAKKVWFFIVNKHTTETIQEIFPFCVRYKLYIKEMDDNSIICKLCSYRERHGICSEKESDHKRIIELFQAKYSIKDFDNVFPKNWKKAAVEISPKLTRLELE